MSRASNGDPRRPFRLGATCLAALFLLTIAGCAEQPLPARRAAEERHGDAVRVASFDFAESELLGELFAQALESEGVRVERAISLGSREVVQPALQQGLVDVVPEYLAAALDFEHLGVGDISGNAEDVAEELATLLADDGVTVMPYARAIDRDAIAMRADRAEAMGIRTILDLAGRADTLDFVGPPECAERSACLPRLRSQYRVEFRSFTGLPPGLPVALALAAGEADVGLMFSSDPLVRDKGLVLLVDDRGFGRPENVVPLVRDEVLERHGDAVRTALSRVVEHLTTEELVTMNRRAAAGEPTAEVAARWLEGVRR